MKPEWEKAADRLKGKVKVVAIDLDEDSNKGIGSRYAVTGFPTIKLFVKGVPKDYTGQRTANAMYASHHNY